MMVDLGDAVALTATCRDASGAPANATSVALTITLPDGSTASPEVTNPPATVGAYEATYVPTAAGLHEVRWLFTDPASATTDVFHVRPASPRMLLSLADAKGRLRKTSSSTDEELRGVIAAATTKVEDVIGPVLRRSIVRERHRVRPGRTAIALRHRMILTVDAVELVDGTVAFDVANLAKDADAGVVWAASGQLPAGDVFVSYTVGRPVVDEAILEATWIIVDHLWETRRGHAARPGMFGQQPELPSGEEQAIAYYAGFALPHRAAELLEPFAVPDGNA